MGRPRRQGATAAVQVGQAVADDLAQGGRGPALAVEDPEPRNRPVFAELDRVAGAQPGLLDTAAIDPERPLFGGLDIELRTAARQPRDKGGIVGSSSPTPTGTSAPSAASQSSVRAAVIQVTSPRQRPVRCSSAATTGLWLRAVIVSDATPFATCCQCNSPCAWLRLVQRPSNFAARFSTKATTPSWKSRVRPQAPCNCASVASWSSSPASKLPRRAVLTAAKAWVGPSAR